MNRYYRVVVDIGFNNRKIEKYLVLCGEFYPAIQSIKEYYDSNYKGYVILAIEEVDYVLESLIEDWI